MKEQIIEIIKETINNIYFIPILIIFTILIIIKSKLDYQKYKKTCEIFQQKPKLTGFIKNSILDIIGIILITTITFIGYVGLTQSEKFENIYKKKIDNNSISTTTESPREHTNNIEKIITNINKNKTEDKKIFKITNKVEEKKKENWTNYEYKNGIKTIKEYKNNKLIKETIENKNGIKITKEYKNGKIITKEYRNDPLNMIIESIN